MEIRRYASISLEMKRRVFTDSDLCFAKALKLPTFEIEGKQLIKRVTLISEAGKIIKVFYPVFPPDKNANEVVGWLENNAV